MNAAMPSPHYIPLGSAPCNEECTDIGSPLYRFLARKECQAYVRAIRKKLGPEPEGATLAVTAFRHSDFGTYYEAVCHFDPAYPASVAYAHRCEREAPERWSDVGMKPPVRHGRRERGR